MVECNLAKVDVEGSNPFSRSQGWYSGCALGFQPNKVGSIPTPRSEAVYAVVLGIGIQRKLKPCGLSGIVSSSLTYGTNRLLGCRPTAGRQILVLAI